MLRPDQPAKRCTKCGELKPIDRYHRARRKPDGRDRQCRECRVAYHRARGQDPARRACERARLRAARERLRIELLLAYGHRCRCCGETTREFLAVDHVNGGGNQHRKSLHFWGSAFYRWLKRQGFPQDEFRLLCHNCNLARGLYGCCPHERGFWV